MPIYEFYCPDNNKIYSFLAKSMAYQDRTPRCPDNREFKMEKRVTGFAFIGNAKDPSSDDPFENVDDAKMESVMAELERDMTGFDEENPDPKQMAHIMRKMSNLTGERLPADMEEMVRRLESGEDPEKLEEEFGDSLDDMSDDAPGDPWGSEDAASRIKRLRQKILGPRRDPNLYEMAEYCD